MKLNQSSAIALRVSVPVQIQYPYQQFLSKCSLMELEL